MTDCSICLKEIIIKYELSCGHGYCRSCISSWVAINDTCPLCRSFITNCDFNKLVLYNNNYINIYIIRLVMISQEEFDYITNKLELDSYYNIYFREADWKILCNKIYKDYTLLKIFRKMEFHLYKYPIPSRTIYTFSFI